MPYIKEEQRKRYDTWLNALGTKGIPTKGDLEYCLFKLLKTYMRDKEVRYSTLHDAVYAAQHVADEFRRRYLDKREDEAREVNGDVEVN